MYRIYINEAVLIIAESIPNPAKEYQQIEFEHFDFLHFYRRVVSENRVSHYFILTKDVDQVFKRIKISLRVIEAAGGLVKNEEGHYLFIFRRGKWDLPKGKIEIGENVKDAAVREVEEECGIKVKQIGRIICKTYHVYELYDELIFKQTTWYHMCAMNQTNLIPQTEEGITDVCWLSVKDMNLVKQNIYPSIQEVIPVIVH